MTNFTSTRAESRIRAALYLLGLMIIVLGAALVAPKQGGIPVWYAVLGLSFAGLVMKASLFDTIKH